MVNDINFLLDQFNKIGKPRTDCNIIKNGIQLHSMNSIKSAEVGFHISRVRFFSDNWGRILQVLYSNPKLSPKQIGQILNIDEPTVKQAITNLFNKGFINEDNNLTQSGISERIIESGKIELRYSYEVKAGLGDKIIDGTRSLCKQLIQLDKLYTYDELSSMVNTNGDPVLTYRGGWYHNPTTKINTQDCRHVWQQQIISK